MKEHRKMHAELAKETTVARFHKPIAAKMFKGFFLENIFLFFGYMLQYGHESTFMISSSAHCCLTTNKNRPNDPEIAKGGTSLKREL